MPEIINEKLTVFIKQLKTNQNISSYNEAETKQAIILPLLGFLGWDRDNTNEVKPEYSVEGGRVDFSLRLKNSNAVFLEVKQTDVDLEKHVKQLLDYSFSHGVELAILTNGMTWWFYLPLKKGDWKTRKFYTIDIKEQESDEIASKFIYLLSRDNIQSGEAIQHAESIYKSRLKKQAIEDTLPEAWGKVVSEPDDLLIKLLAETTEKICGYKPDNNIVKKFIADYVPKNIPTVQEGITPAFPDKTSGQDNKPSYLDAYLEQLKNPNTLGSKIKRYLEKHRVISFKELKRICVTEFGCKRETSGSIGASIRALEEAGFIKREGRGDSQRLIIR